MKASPAVAAQPHLRQTCAAEPHADGPVALQVQDLLRGFVSALEKVPPRISEFNVIRFAGSRMFVDLAAAAWLGAAAMALAAVPAGAQDPAAGRLYQEAERLLSAGEVQAAQAELRLLVQQFQRDELAPKALLTLVDLYRAAGEEQETRAALDKLLTNYARTQEAASGFLIQAEVKVEKARTLSDLDEARSIFRRVPLLFGAESYPDLQARSRARLRGGELALLAGDIAAAEAEFVAVVEDEPPSSYTGRARQLLGRTLLVKGELPAAMEILQRLAEDAEATETDRANARILLSLAHRHLLRPRAGEPHWGKTVRFPASGLALREPIGVAAADDGRVLIVDKKEAQVSLLDSAGNKLSNRPLKDPQRPAWAEDVALVVTDDEVVLPFDAQRMGFLEPKTGKERPLDGLRAAVRGPFGDWFLIAKGWNSILNYQSRRQGHELSSRQRADFVDVERDSAGRVYGLDAREKQVTRLALDRRTQKVLISGAWKKPVALSLDPLGHIYVLDRGERKVSMYSPEGALITSVGPNLDGGIELRDPRDISVDGSGRLFIADSKLPFIILLD